MRLAFYIIENQLQCLDNMIIYSPWDMDDANGLKLVQYNLDWFLFMHREDRALWTQRDRHCKNFFVTVYIPWINLYVQPLCTEHVNAKSSFTTVETRFLCSPLGARFDNYLLLIRDQSTYDMLRPRFFCRSISYLMLWRLSEGKKVSLWCTLVAVSSMMDYYYSFFNNGILSHWIVSLVTLLKFFLKNVP